MFDEEGVIDHLDIANHIVERSGNIYFVVLRKFYASELL